MFSAKSPEEQAQELRIRTALGLNKGPLPNVEVEWLRKYYEYLAANLSLPFDARYAEEGDYYRKPAYHQVKVLALLDPDKNPGREYNGLICRTHATDREIEVPLVDLEIEADNPNFQIIEDYWYWIWNWRFDPRI
ncbi:MAG: calcium-binding protein [Thermoguttaceae bacterium]|jgi:hypothetical protein